MSDIVFAEGFWFNEAKPEYIKGNITINAGRFIQWLNQQQVDEKGNVKLVVKESKGGKIYTAIDNWKPDPNYRSGQGQSPAQNNYTQAPQQEISADSGNFDDGVGEPPF